jgi:hypothetical protein
MSMKYFSHLLSMPKTPQAALLISSMLVSSIVIGVNSAQAVTFGSNLILNGGAEADIGGIGGTIGPVTDWTTTGQFTVITYNNNTGYPTNADPGPVNRGNNFFGGGGGNSSSGSQLITLAPGFTEIDAGSVSFDLSGFLGGFSTDNDNAALTAVFRDASNTGLGTFSIGPVSAIDRSNVTGLFARSTSGTVPIGTRNILLTLNMERVVGSSNDGYADNLSLVLNNNTATAVPEPFTVIGTLVGGTAALRLRKKLRAARK